MADRFIFTKIKRARDAVTRAALTVVLLSLGACQQAATLDPVPLRPKTIAAANGEDSGALSSPGRPDATPRAAVLKGSDWPALQLRDGKAEVVCAATADAPVETTAGAGIDAIGESPTAVPQRSGTLGGGPSTVIDAAHHAPSEQLAARAGEGDAHDGDGGVDADMTASVGAAELADLAYAGVAYALAPCREAGALRLRYSGKIGGDFTALMQRVSAMADRMAIDTRVLEIDSSGGRVEDAMRAGDLIAESHWIIDVRDDAVCHSACSLVLAAGDNREISGLVGIHRMIRIGSMATSRAEVSQELRNVYGQMKDYLERNGASVAVADLMMTVPNRSLRLLSADELQAYGLSGTNAVQDDLNRIRLTRRCGDAFVKRRDAYVRAYDAQCGSRDAATDAIQRCDVALRDRLQFPQDSCDVQRPVAGEAAPRRSDG